MRRRNKNPLVDSIQLVFQFIEKQKLLDKIENNSVGEEICPVIHLELHLG